MREIKHEQDSQCVCKIYIHEDVNSCLYMILSDIIRLWV